MQTATDKQRAREAFARADQKLADARAAEAAMSPAERAQLERQREHLQQKFNSSLKPLAR